MHILVYLVHLMLYSSSKSRLSLRQKLCINSKAFLFGERDNTRRKKNTRKKNLIPQKAFTLSINNTEKKN